MSKEKYTNEYLSQICKDNNCIFIKVSHEERGNKKRKRKIVYFICNEHSEYGIQSSEIDHFIRNKKKCCYCNHNKLGDIFPQEVNKVNNTINVVGQYINWNTPVSCECKACHHQWDATPSVILYGGGCPICGRTRATNKRKKSQDEAINELSVVAPNIKVVGEYNSFHRPILCECKLCGYQFEKNYSSLFYSPDCPMCLKKQIREKQALSQDEFVKRAYKQNSNIKIVGKYVNNNTPVECRCLIHNISFKANPRNLLYKRGNVCKYCFISDGEKKLLEILKNKGFNIVPQYSFDDCKNIDKLKFDAYDVDNKIAYEYQGEQHYYPIDFDGLGEERAKQEFDKGIKRDKIKRDYCNKHNIPLIDIPYWEKDNMEEYLKSRWENEKIFVD